MQSTLAEIRMFGGNFAPRGWALCEGQLLPISQNQALFSLLGTIYGGDGRTTFALPDFRGRMVIGPGTGPGLPNYRQGAKSGTETNTMTTQQMPSHTHGAAIVGTLHSKVGNSVDGDDPTGAFLGKLPDANKYYGTGTGTSLGGPLGVGITATVLDTGAATPINNMQPYLSVNFIIALVGTFPSRS